MKRYRLLLLLIGSVLLLNGCRKDDDDAVTLYALLSEQPGGDSKIYIDDLYACWENDDQIKINDTPYPVVVTNDAEALGGRKAAIYTVTTASTFTAAYPSEYVTNCNGGAVTLEIPSAQTYNNNAIGGKQNIVAPCVGYSGDLDFHDDHTAEEPLIMRNVGGLLHVTVENNLSQTLTLYAIEVESSVAYIAGTGDVDASSSEPSMTLCEHKSKSITLHCNASNISLEPSKSKDFYMVVAPFSEATKFTVHVLATGNDDSKKYTFHRESNSNITIGRNQLGNITTKLDADHTTGTERLFWGQGTESCPYMITCYADLDLLRKVVNYDAPFNTSDYQETYNRNSVHYIQTADIDIKTGSGVDTNNWGFYTTVPPVRNFRPIGYSTTQYFQANYNGMYHTVSGISYYTGAISATDLGSNGLFGYAGGGTIENLTVQGNYTNTKQINIGGIVGESVGSTLIIKNCINKVHIYNNYNQNWNNYGFGGICGCATSQCFIQNCENKSNIEVNNWLTNINMGGIIGLVNGNASQIQYCINSGVIRHPQSKNISSSMGGICGRTTVSISIHNCQNNADITSKNGSTQTTYLGGILGKVETNTTHATISQCRNSGNIQAPTGGTSSYIAGIVGCSTGCNNITLEKDTNQGQVIGYGKTAGIIAYTYSSGTIAVSKCENLGIINSGNSYTAGIYGHATNSIAEIKNCSNQATITGTGYVGGIIGYNQTNGSFVKQCTNSGNINVTGTNVGGIAGNFQYANITECKNSGDIATATAYVGGIVGNSNIGSISRCLNTASISSTKNGSNVTYAGGIVGYCAGTATTDQFSITDCGNEGNITCTGGKCCGGILGYGNTKTTEVCNCYNRGDLLGTGTQAGGIVGCPYSNVSKLRIKNCYWSGIFASTPIASNSSNIIYPNGYASVISITDCYANENSHFTENTKPATSLFNSNTGAITSGTAYGFASTLGDALRAWQSDNSVYLGWTSGAIPTLDWSGIFTEAAKGSGIRRSRR